MLFELPIQFVVRALIWLVNPGPGCLIFSYWGIFYIFSRWLHSPGKEADTIADCACELYPAILHSSFHLNFSAPITYYQYSQVDGCLMPSRLSCLVKIFLLLRCWVYQVPGTRYVQGEPHCMHQVPRCLGVFIINLSKSWAVKIGSPYTGPEY